MALFPRGPHSEFSTLFRLLDDYDAHRADRGTSGGVSFVPKFDVRETKDAFVLDGELPGIAQEDINIEFSDRHTLSIHGRTERTRTSGTPPSKRIEGGKGKETETGEQASERYWVSERSVGEFQRSFNFPTTIDQEGVKASLKHGVLSVIIPKATAPQTKKITVETA